MKRYIEHIHSREPHERRQHAMQIAGAVTAAVFAVWITTLGLRLGGTSNVATEDNQSLSASAAQSIYTGENQLMVAPTDF